MRNRREFELPFVPTLIVGAVLLTWAMGVVLTSQSHPADALRELETLGGDLVGTELHLSDPSIGEVQQRYMLGLARVAHRERVGIDEGIELATEHRPRIRAGR
jgi:phage terminase large subunit-like protein